MRLSVTAALDLATFFSDKETPLASEADKTVLQRFQRYRSYL